MKDLAQIFEVNSTNEVRIKDKTVEVWKMNSSINIEKIQEEKQKFEMLITILNTLEEDYVLLTLLIKNCKRCPIVDNKNNPLSALDIKYNLLKYVTEEWAARNTILQQYYGTVFSSSSSSSNSSSSSSSESLESKDKEPKKPT